VPCRQRERERERQAVKGVAIWDITMRDMTDDDGERACYILELQDRGRKKVDCHICRFASKREHNLALDRESSFV
jgi:hypothetical protein